MRDRILIYERAYAERFGQVSMCWSTLRDMPDEEAGQVRAENLRDSEIQRRWRERDQNGRFVA